MQELQYFIYQQQQSLLFDPKIHIIATAIIIIHIILSEPNQDELLQQGWQQGLHGDEQSLMLYPSFYIISL